LSSLRPLFAGERSLTAPGSGWRGRSAQFYREIRNATSHYHNGDRITLALAAGWGSGSIAGEIQVAGTFEVKANSIWFEDAAKLARWQRLRKRGNAKAPTSYRDKVLSKRDAWQFVNPLTVKIISYDRGNTS
jgi:hypothetical protein